MLKSLDTWLIPYLRHAMRRRPAAHGMRHLIFCLADHFEPMRGGRSVAAARDDLRSWVDDYRAFAARCHEATGACPRHTWFYPAEEYDPQSLDMLAELVRDQLGEVEIHLHHRNDTADRMRATLGDFRDRLHNDHGLLGSDAAGLPRYGFIHGNWALCNSRPDGDWCGVNEELTILRQTGCYADFTFPSAPSPTQSPVVNKLYYASDTPGKPRGCDYGLEVRAGGGEEVRGKGKGVRGKGKEGRGKRSEDRSQRSEDRSQRPEDGSQEPEFRIQDIADNNLLPEDSSRFQVSSFKSHISGFRSQVSGLPLLIIPGPLALDWRRRKWGLLPRIENGALTGANPPTPSRIRIWVRQNIHVAGCAEWVFVKVYTHGCVPENRAALLGDAMLKAHVFLRSAFNDGSRWRLHYATAREMCNLVRAAEDGHNGDPGRWLDYEISPPPASSRGGKG
jgi:hypothetical protein